MIALDTDDDAVFCGDTGFHEGVDGDIKLPENWTDAWEALHPESPGFTFDGKRNKMLAKRRKWNATRKRNATKKRPPRRRFDRCWVKLRHFRLKDIQLLDKHIKKGLWPSDHFGLF